MAFLSADKRVAHILVQLGTFFKKKENDRTYTIDYTHQELADLIGLARVTTTKKLKGSKNTGGSYWIIKKFSALIKIFKGLFISITDKRKRSESERFFLSYHLFFLILMHEFDLIDDQSQFALF